MFSQEFIGGRKWFQPVTVSSDTLGTDLMAFWRLDETTGNRIDSGPYGLTLTNSSAGYTNGIISNAVWITGSQYLVRKDEIYYSITNDQAFTVSGFFRYDSLADDRPIISQNQNGKPGWVVWWSQGSSVFRFSVADISGTLFHAAASTISATSNYCFNAWYDPDANKIGLQLWGGIHTGATNSTAFTGVATNSIADIAVGYNYNGGSTYMRGLVDHVRIHKRLLTEAEKAQIRAEGGL